MKIEDYKMRILFEMDKKDYVPNGSVFSRPSARAIIIKDGKIAMVYSKKYNYYFLCRVKEDLEQQNLDKYEADEGFTLEFPEPQLAINVNRETILDDFTQVMLEREALVLELLIQEGYFKCGGKSHENT